MTAVTELGYVRFGVSSLEEWRAFATDLVGLEIGDDSEPGRLYLRSDQWHHRIALEENGADDLIGAGLRVAGPAEFTAMQAHLSELGVPYEVAGDGLARDRHVLELLTLSDPAGIPLEIFHGPQVEAHRPFPPRSADVQPFRDRRRRRGPRAGESRGPGGDLRLLPEPRDARQPGVPDAHAGWQYGRIPVHARQLARPHVCLRRARPTASTSITSCWRWTTWTTCSWPTDSWSKSQYPITVPLGRHANDQTFSFYFKGPSGFQVEIGWGGRPATHQSEYYTRDTYRGPR